MNWPDRTPIALDPVEHAACILTALNGNYQLALDNIEVYATFYGLDYAMRLAFCLKPGGNA